MRTHFGGTVSYNLEGCGANRFLRLIHDILCTQRGIVTDAC